jgi:hypothetical protein
MWSARGDRLGFDHPWVDLLALPVALLLGWLLSAGRFGRLLLFPLQIQFHELGHAVVAWLSSRAALPLPFGFTFWRESQSSFVALCMLFLIGAFGYRADREGSRFGVGLAFVLAGAWLWLSRGISAERSLMWVIAGGCAGELWISALVMLGFYFPLPDRLRWDFFRFLALPPAAAVWLAAARLWRRVARGTALLPRGSILGAGDANGDMDRLLDHYDFTPAGLARLYFGLAVCSGLLCLGVYAWFALRAVRKLREEASG